MVATQRASAAASVVAITVLLLFHHCYPALLAMGSQKPRTPENTWEIVGGRAHGGGEQRFWRLGSNP